MSKYGPIAALLVAICLGTLALYYHGQYATAQQSLNSTQAVTKNALTAIKLMHDISKATHDEKQKLADEGAARVVYIREAVKDDQCAVRDVATAATEHLRLLENRVRAGQPAEAKP